MNFDQENACRRLDATERALRDLDSAIRTLDQAGVRNGAVWNRLTGAKRELTDYRRTTKFAITKREKRCRPSTS